MQGSLVTKGVKTEFVQNLNLVTPLLQNFFYLGSRKRVFWATQVGEREKFVQK